MSISYRRNAILTYGWLLLLFLKHCFHSRNAPIIQTHTAYRLHLHNEVFQRDIWLSNRQPTNSSACSPAVLCYYITLSPAGEGGCMQRRFPANTPDQTGYSQNEGTIATSSQLAGTASSTMRTSRRDKVLWTYRTPVLLMTASMLVILSALVVGVLARCSNCSRAHNRLLSRIWSQQQSNSNHQVKFKRMSTLHMDVSALTSVARSL